MLVKDINPTGSELASLTSVRGTLYFTRVDEAHGRELWKLDRSKRPKRATLVEDIKPGFGGSRPADH